MGLLSLRDRSEPPSEPAKCPSPKTLLIVDDEPQDISSIVRILQKEEICIIMAGSGGKAMEILRKQPVSVVLSDRNMPSMDGLGFLDKVREHDDDILWILLTGYAGVDSAIDAAVDEIIHLAGQQFDTDTVNAFVGLVSGGLCEGLE